MSAIRRSVPQFLIQNRFRAAFEKKRLLGFPGRGVDVNKSLWRERCRRRGQEPGRLRGCKERVWCSLVWRGEPSVGLCLRPLIPPFCFRWRFCAGQGESPTGGGVPSFARIWSWRSCAQVDSDSRDGGLRQSLNVFEMDLRPRSIAAAEGDLRGDGTTMRRNFVVLTLGVWWDAFELRPDLIADGSRGFLFLEATVIGWIIGGMMTGYTEGAAVNKKRK